MGHKNALQWLNINYLGFVWRVGLFINDPFWGRLQSKPTTPIGVCLNYFELSQAIACPALK